MRNKLCALVLVVTGVFFAGVANAMAGEIRVDDDGAQCANAQFTSIQAAVNAAQPGDKVTVCPGTYNEQVTIGAGKDHLKVVSQRPLQATIKAPATMTEPGDLVRITSGVQDVQLKDFTIAGPLPDTLFCSLEARTGVRVDSGASATIEKNHVTEIRSTSPALRGCQNGLAIFVDDATATVKNNTVELYQKNGITVSGANASAKVENNTVTSPGATEITAPNGIQVSDGAYGEVRGNSVSGNVYDQAPASNGTGILLFAAAAGTIVENNDVFGNDDGISLYDQVGAKVKNNKSHDQLVYDGFFADNGSNGNLFENNKAYNNAEHDCHDDSNGSGTGGTGNTWKNDQGQTANRPGICKPCNVV
jgi:parallel beta-helix repeat protein